jgi:hypothetical protein
MHYLRPGYILFISIDRPPTAAIPSAAGSEAGKAAKT